MSRSFSPYGYNIKYRVKGKNPNQTYNYVQGAGPNVSVLTSTRLTVSYYSYLKSKYTFYLDDYNQLNIDNCKRLYFIASENVNSFPQQFNQEDVYIPHAYKIYSKEQIKELQDNNYQIDIDSSVFLKDFYDVIIFNNNEFITKYCKICFNDLQSKIKIQISQKCKNIQILVYSLRSLFNKFKLILDSQYVIQSDDDLLIYNLSGTRNVKFILKDKNDESLILNNYNISQDFITYYDTQLSGLSDNSFGYQAQYPKTFIISKNVSINSCNWISKKQVIINHNLNGYVDFIFDQDPKLKNQNYRVFYIDKNNIKINFEEEQNISDISSITCFKVGE